MIIIKQLYNVNCMRNMEDNLMMKNTMNMLKNFHITEKLVQLMQTYTESLHQVKLIMKHT